MSGIERGISQDIAGLETKTGAALSGMTVDEGSNTPRRAAIILGAGEPRGRIRWSMAGLTTGTAGNIAQAQQAANNTITQAGTGALRPASRRRQTAWGAALGVLGAGTKLLGGSAGGGFGSLIGSLFK